MGAVHGKAKSLAGNAHDGVLSNDSFEVDGGIMG
jgi:hypothetical protein